MKIVSKYKDFYDFIVQDHDSDLIYVRSIGLVNEYYDNLFYKENHSIPYYSKYYGYQNYFSKKRENGELEFDNFIFGIYPFVYSQPILKIYYKYKYNTDPEMIFIILGKDLVDRLLDNNNDINKKAFDELKSLAQKEFDKKFDNGICKYAKVDFATYNKINDLKGSLQMKTWKDECPDIFYKIESPVFIKYYYDLFVNGTYYDNWPKEPKIGNDKTIHYITGISFQKLNHNILKYWYNDLFDMNTYINIENFLWSVKQEPEAKPDNKTKIVSHGFDLKTSFRKM